MKKGLLSSGIMMMAVLLCIESKGQQQAMYTQYMFNGLLLNPAYAGSQETFSASALARKQWLGIDGAPETQTFSAHSPLDDLRTHARPGSRVGVGLTIFHDKIAITDQSAVMAAYSYRIPLGAESSLYLGLQGGFSYYRIRYSQLGLDDPAFALGDAVEWKPDLGAGVYLRARRFYAGLSSPQMIRPEISYSGNSMAMTPPHLFLTAGYVFDINEALKLKPNVLLKNFAGSVYQVDANLNVYLHETVGIGMSWRSTESFTSLLQIQVHRRFALGYAHDFGYGSGISGLGGGSHEFMVNYHVPKNKLRTVNPRFF